MTTRELLKFLKTVPDELLDQEIIYKDGSESIYNIKEAEVTETDIYEVDYSWVTIEDYFKIKDLYEHLDDYTMEIKHKALTELKYVFGPISIYTEDIINERIENLFEESELILKKGQILLS